jgi:hypothetical protein
MLCDEEALYRAYLEHKAKVEAEGQARAEAETRAEAQSRAQDAAARFAADAAPARKITE